MVSEEVEERNVLLQLLVAKERYDSVCGRVVVQERGSAFRRQC